MSVRLRPTVRCSFDEAQSALRVTLREPIEDTQHEHLVIYALKVRKGSCCFAVMPIRLELTRACGPACLVAGEGVAIGVCSVREDGRS